MNLITVPLLGGGDFGEFVKTFDKQTVPRIIIIFVGLSILILGYIFIQKAFMPVTTVSRGFLVSLALIPLGMIVVLQSLSLIKNPFTRLPLSQNHFVASVFAFFHFVLWALDVIFIPLSGNKSMIKIISPEQSISWIIVGGILSILYIIILGPGIGSFKGHPNLLNYERKNPNNNS